MNVTGLLVECINEQVVDGIDHVMIIGRQLVGGLELDIPLKIAQVHGRPRKLMLGRRNGSFKAKKLFDKLDDVRPGAYYGVDLHLAGTGNILEDFQVKRIRRGNGEFSLADLHGQHQVVFSKGDGNGGGDHIQVQLQGVDLNERNTPAFCQGLKNGILIQRFRRVVFALQVQRHNGINEDKRFVPVFNKIGLALFDPAPLELFDQFKTVAVKVPCMLE
jgi:hypothetical protein